MQPAATVVLHAIRTKQDLRLDANRCYPGPLLGRARRSKGGHSTAPPPTTRNLTSQVPTIKITDLARLRAAASMVEEATKILQHAKKGGLTGFTGTAIEERTLVLYWHGKLPAEVRQTIADAAMKVKARSAPYPATVLDAGACRLSMVSGVVGTEFLPDFSGVRVSVADATVARQLTTRLNSKVK
jgi:hypothetical protein